MQRFFASIVIMSALLTGGVQPWNAYADDLWDKGGRGIADIVSSPFEVIRQGKIDFSEKGGVGIFSGGFRGAAYMFARLGVGVYELVTFPLPSYEAILDPEFIIPPAPRTHAEWGEENISRVY